MRRAKVQRQEERREKRLKFGRRPKKESKAEGPTLYTVVLAEDVRQTKYHYCGADGFDGYTLEHAERLAAPVPGQRQSYAVLPVDVHRWARAQGKPIGVKAAIAGFGEAA